MRSLTIHDGASRRKMMQYELKICLHGRMMALNMIKRVGTCDVDDCHRASMDMK
jgi:hypothetical protein